MDLKTLLPLIIAAVVYWLAIVFIPGLLIRRAMAQVIRIFRRHGALNAEQARHLAELDLHPLVSSGGNGKWRGYKPTALAFPAERRGDQGDKGSESFPLRGDIAENQRRRSLEPPGTSQTRSKKKRLNRRKRPCRSEHLPNISSRCATTGKCGIGENACPMSPGTR